MLYPLTVTTSISYDELIEREARHWSAVESDPHTPQLWDNEALFEVFFGKERRDLIQRAAASGPRVLELGCGNGNLARKLAERGLRVEGIDLSSERIASATDSCADLPSDQRPTFRVGDLNTIELGREQFDTVIAYGSLHHILRLDHLLDQVHRTLRPSGRFLVYDYVGMSVFPKLVAATLYALLPTYKPYSEKWKLRRRLASFLASEKQKRAAMSEGKTSLLHEGSPFEEISGRSIPVEIRNRFRVLDEQSSNPFWFYLAAKVRMPKVVRLPVARFLHALDNLLLAIGFSGTFVFVDATKP